MLISTAQLLRRAHAVTAKPAHYSAITDKLSGSLFWLPALVSALTPNDFVRDNSFCRIPGIDDQA
jgi:hypothetical protein